MVIDMRTRLPHGHLAAKGADMAFHARRLKACADQLNGALAELRAVVERGRAEAGEAA